MLDLGSAGAREAIANQRFFVLVAAERAAEVAYKKLAALWSLGSRRAGSVDSRKTKPESDAIE